MHRSKTAMTGITGAATVMPNAGTDQAAVHPVALRTGVMDHGVVRVNSTANRGMTP